MLRHMLNGAAVVKAVGQFYEHYADVVVESEEDTLEILCLEALLGDIRATGLLLRVKDVLYLGEAVHKGCNLVPEFRPEVFHGIISVFHYIVEQGGRY